MSSPRILQLSLVMLVVALLSASFVSAATITVTNLNDSGPGSLRQAIADASSGDTINFSVAGIITLTSGELNIDKDLTIEGPGVNELAISGNNSSRVINIYSWNIPSGAVVTVSSITISDGNAGPEGGGGIRIWSSDVEPSTLELANVNVLNNQSEHSAGGIEIISGIVNISNSNISNNSLAGIINSYGTLTITNSTISNNLGHRGGGIRNVGTANVTNSVISNNAAGLGGGIINDYGTLVLTNSTISGNEAYDVPTLATWGGGIANWGELVLINSTITQNTAEEGGDGIYSRGSVTLSNTIIANNNPHADCYDEYGNLTSTGFNLDSDGTCNLTQLTDLPNTEPSLGPLVDNGGPTETHALLDGSTAIDAGAQNCTDVIGAPLLTDQRGEPRPVDGNGDGQTACDIGAFEVQLSWLTVSIDIKPGSDKNPVNPKSNGKHKVAVITTDEFDASTVDADSVLFGPEEAEPVSYQLDDVDYDGDLDLVLKFKTQETGISCGDTEATLIAETFGGQGIAGTDSVKTVGCKNAGKQNNKGK